MKKRVLAILAIVAVLFGSTVVGYSYWDSLQQNTSSDYEIGYGVRLEVPTQTEDSRALVPAGSFYSAYEADYTTAFTFEYTLTLEDALQSGMEADLLVDISDFKVNEILAAFNLEGSLFTVTVGTDAVTGSVSADGEWSFTDAFYYENNTVVVSVTIELADNGTAGFDADDYNFVSGQNAGFAIGFELVNSSSSTDTPAV